MVIPKSRALGFGEAQPPRELFLAWSSGAWGVAASQELFLVWSSGAGGGADSQELFLAWCSGAWGGAASPRTSLFRASSCGFAAVASPKKKQREHYALRVRHHAADHRRPWHECGAG